MKKPVKVVGWEKIVGKNDKCGIRIYGERELDSSAEGFVAGEGMEAVRLYINPEYTRYEPQIGHLIIPVEGRYGIDQIYVVG